MPELRLDRDSGAEEWTALDDDLVPGLEAAGNQPIVTDGSIGLHHAKLGHAFGSHDQYGRTAALITADPALRDEDAARLDALREQAADKHSRQQDMLGVGEHRANGLRARRRIHGHVG